VSAGSIRVLLVDDSPLVLSVLKRLLAAAPEIQVVGTAKNGREALELIPQLDPSVVCTDYHMPVMDGLELTRAIMARYPRPILVVSTAVGPENNATVFELLQAGAIDVFPKPKGLETGNVNGEQLINKIKVVSGVFVFPRRPKGSATSELESSNGARLGERPPLRLLAIGASTGGPQALQVILTKLPTSFPVPVLCVQHISAGFLQGLVDWLAGQCHVRVAIARSGQLALPGNVYFPEEQRHLVIDSKGRLQNSDAPPVGGHRPSVTVTFQSVAVHYGPSAVAVLLTGMGRDGCDGMAAIRQARGVTYGQDEASCVVYGMPKEAIERGLVDYILPPDEIARRLVETVKG